MQTETIMALLDYMYILFFFVHQKIPHHHKRLVKFYVCSEPGSKT